MTGGEYDLATEEDEEGLVDPSGTVLADPGGFVLDDIPNGAC
jgi:hypothetical protein